MKRFKSQVNFFLFVKYNLILTPNLKPFFMKKINSILALLIVFLFIQETFAQEEQSIEHS
ncbi:MAG: hypothetical protein CVT98_03175 [Bacteroidetes bacterium HGW-Bacteroidetes-15]|nr:MAG: hypothetical protein CVT98_03175 [Bacteroidetes bacterium HGW-Bacteroidetes-15]